MKILIAILSCTQYAKNGVNQSIRDTWAAGVPLFPGVEYCFLLGDNTPTGDDETALRGSFEVHVPGNPSTRVHRARSFEQLSSADVSNHVPKADEQVWHVPDAYVYTSYKLKQVSLWAFAAGYDFIFHCCADTYIDLYRLVHSGFEKYDWSGKNVGGPPWHAASGGGFWVSRKAVDAYMTEPVDDSFSDRWVGVILRRKGFDLQHDGRYVNYPSSPSADNDFITSHLFEVPERYDPQRMYDVHAKSGNLPHYGKARP